jgi:Ca2+-binding EF-hand superfamily protein
LRAGYLTLTELLALTTKNNFQSDVEEAKVHMQWLDADGDDRVSRQEFCEAMDFFLSGLDEEDFDETVYNIMSSSHLSFFSRQEKLQMAFRKLDVSLDDVLDLDEMMAFGRTFGTGVDVRKAKMTILWMDQDGDRKVCVEFLTCLSFRFGLRPPELMGPCSPSALLSGEHGRILESHGGDNESPA